MIYSYYSIPRFERSSSLDRGIYDFSSGLKKINSSRYFLDNYRKSRTPSVRASSLVQDFSRASSVSPINISAKEYVPSNSLYSYRQRRRSVSFDDDILPTSNLKAHTPPKYSYVFAPEGNYNQRKLLYLDEDINPYPTQYRTYNQYYYPFSLNSLNNRYYSNRNYYYPTSKSIYTLSRVPENPFYYRYNVLPYYGYDANDMLRQRRRKIDSRIGYYSDFHAAPLQFFTGLKRNLNEIHNKMESHRLLLDRYTGIDMNPNSSSVGENILEKSLQMSYRRRL